MFIFENHQIITQVHWKSKATFQKAMLILKFVSTKNYPGFNAKYGPTLQRTSICICKKKKQYAFQSKITRQPSMGHSLKTRRLLLIEFIYTKLNEKCEELFSSTGKVPKRRAKFMFISVYLRIILFQGEINYVRVRK